MLQKPVFALLGCQPISVNSLLCDTLIIIFSLKYWGNNVYFWGNNVYFGGDNLYFWGFSKILDFWNFFFVARGGFGTLWVGGARTKGFFEDI